MTEVRPAAIADLPLAPLTTLGVGGPARWFVRATEESEVVAVHRWCLERGMPLFVLGGGSNLVVSDAGFAGVVLQPALTGMTFDASNAGETVTAGAGEVWDDLVSAVVARGAVGLECLSGIPGLVGGTPIQNVGAYGQEVAGAIDCVRVFDRTDGTFKTIDAAGCGFAYRTSRFKGPDAGRFIVCAVRFHLHRGSPTAVYPDIIRYLREAGTLTPSVVEIRQAVLAVRRTKGMVIDPADADTRSVGSFFMNPVVHPSVRERIASTSAAAPPAFACADGRVKLPAAWLIEHAGLAKGLVDGAVGISTRHPLALVNRGGASARDVLRLASRIKRRVSETFGVWLQPEPIFVGFVADPDVDYLRRTDA